MNSRFSVWRRLAARTHASRSEVSLDFAHGCAVIQSRAEPHLVHSECHYRVSSEAPLLAALPTACMDPCRGDSRALPGKGQCPVACTPAPGEKGGDTTRFLLVAQWKRGLGGLWAASVLAAEGLPAPCCRTGSSAPRGCVAWNASPSRPGGRWRSSAQAPLGDHMVQDV